MLIAVVEDNPELRTDLVEFLSLQGSFTAQGFESGEAFFAVWPRSSFHLLLLDVALPGMSGLEIARQVRARHAVGKLPEIVMLTALDSSSDHVQGLEAGAAMYLSKRSPLDVIGAACHSVQRRLERDTVDSMTAVPMPATDAWLLDTRDWIISAPNGRSLALTHAEVIVLAMLFEQPGQVVARKALLLRLEKATPCRTCAIWTTWQAGSGARPWPHATWSFLCAPATAGAIYSADAAD